MAKIKVLLVDDHKMFRQGIKTVLTSLADIKVIGEADTGEEALEKIKKIKPDIVVMDINMSGINGIEASKKVKEFDKNIKILLLTMLENEKFIMDALSSGVEGYLFKEADASELIKAIKTIASGKEYINDEVKEKIINYVTHNNFYSQNINQTTSAKLTPRELEIVQHVSKGYTSRVIAEKLFISEFTVIKHRKNIIRKLGLKNFHEVVSYAISNGLI